MAKAIAGFSYFGRSAQAGGNLARRGMFAYIGAALSGATERGTACGRPLLLLSLADLDGRFTVPRQFASSQGRANLAPRSTQMIRRFSPVLLPAAAVSLSLGLAASIWLTLRSADQFGWVEHTLQVQKSLVGLLSSVQDAEIGQRGYVITGDDSYLQPYTNAVASIGGQVTQLRRLTADNPRQVNAVLQLEPVLQDKLDELEEIVVLRRAGDTPRATELVRIDRGRELMDRIRAVIARMDAEEASLLQDRRAAAETTGGLLLAAIAACTALAFALFALWRRNERRSAQELESSRAELSVANEGLRGANENLLREIEQRAAAENLLRQAQKMEAVGQLTGGVAHDFNNMLAIIVGALNLMRRRLDRGDANIQKYVDAATEGATRAATLTQRLLAFSRQQPLTPEVIDANKLVSGMSEMLRRTLGEAIKIETVLAGGLWRSYADANQLETAIINLAVNARDAMPDGGSLTIETANTALDDDYARRHAIAAGQYVMIAVSDTGTGMPSDIAGRAFDPFFTTKGVGKGTGLGLSMVYGYVRQSQGHVKIYSEPGQGTTVKIYLPRWFGAAETAAKPELDRKAPVGDAREVILVVEDEERVRRLSVDSLRELGYTVVHADGASSALRKLETHPDVALLFTDIVMPEVNGRRLAEEATRRRPGLKVLYTTGYTRNAVVHNGVVDPGVELINKPFTLEQLAQKVRSVLNAAPPA